jgi:natural product biosynthesis luciferase-like monooxygenase protein
VDAERHFHAFGGLYPNPSVMAAALSTITSRVALRCGSVVAPLHDSVRLAEEWSVVDNLSQGRVGLAFASGWNSNDFVLAPSRFAERKQRMNEQLADFRRLWRGEPVRRVNGTGQEVDVGSSRLRCSPSRRSGSPRWGRSTRSSAPAPWA